MTSLILDQSTIPWVLLWTFDDPVNLSFIVGEYDWSGDYTAEIRTSADRDAALLDHLTVTAVYGDAGAWSAVTEPPYTEAGTMFTLELADSSTVPPGASYCDLQQAGGRTRMSGPVIVKHDITI